MRTEVSDRSSLCLQIIGVLLGVMGLLAYAISKFSSGKAVVIGVLENTTVPNSCAGFSGDCN